MAIKLDNEDKTENSIGIAFMEGIIGQNDMAATYAKFEKQPVYKSETALWTPYRDGEKRLSSYTSPADRKNHSGSVELGHTAIILRRGGIVTRIVGFVPTAGMDHWPCPGTWMNNFAMVNDPLALSYEIRNNHDANVIEDTLNWLGTAKDDWKFKYTVPKWMGWGDKDTYNCIGAALTVLTKKATETQTHWERLLKACASVEFRQSMVKAGIMTGDLLVQAGQ